MNNNELKQLILLKNYEIKSKQSEKEGLLMLLSSKISNTVMWGTLIQSFFDGSEFSLLKKWFKSKYNFNLDPEETPIYRGRDHAGIGFYFKKNRNRYQITFPLNIEPCNIEDNRFGQIYIQKENKNNIWVIICEGYELGKVLNAFNSKVGGQLC